MIDLFHQFLVENFLGRIMAGGFLLALAAGPVGCLVIWKRMAFFGDAIAHSSLLGVGLGMMLGIDIRLSVLIFIIFLAISLGIGREEKVLGTDARLALLSHGALACGLLVISFFPTLRGDVSSFLFGDILALSTDDFTHILLLTIFVFTVLIVFWKRFLMLILSGDVAFVEGQNTLVVRLFFFLLIGVFIAIASRIVGVLLMTALLVIPAASVRSLSRSPVQMVFLASFASAVSVVGGILGSWYFDLPVSPCIIVFSLLIYIPVSLIRK